MSFWEEWGDAILGITGLGTTIIAWNRESITNRLSKKQDTRDDKASALTASEQAVNIMQDVLASVNEARAADKEREDACHKALAREKEERQREVSELREEHKIEVKELRDMMTRLENVVEVYRKRVVEVETKFGQA